MRAKRVDSNQKTIVDAYKLYGFSVADLSAAGDGFPDLVVGKFGRSWLVEVKTLNGKLRKTQKEFRENWRGCYRVSRTINDVIRHAKEALNEHEKVS